MITAILAMAVIFIGLMSGCATKRDADEIKAQIANLESQSDETRERMARMDSLVTASTESNKQLQNDVRYSTDQLAQQLSQLLENYNDLMARLDQVSGQQVIRLAPTSSPGASADSLNTSGEEPPPGVQPSIDCINTYDNAFTQARRGEYEPAIEGFRSYVEACSDQQDAENAYFWMGECYYRLDQYTQAIEELEFLIDTYPESPNIGRALYKLGRCKQETGKNDEAKTLYQRLVDEHGGTWEAEQATERLKDL
jgi:tol-pal system protein YbgF